MRIVSPCSRSALQRRVTQLLIQEPWSRDQRSETRDPEFELGRLVVYVFVAMALAAQPHCSLAMAQGAGHHPCRENGGDGRLHSRSFDGDWLGRAIWERLTGVAIEWHDYLRVRLVQGAWAPLSMLEIEAGTHAYGFVHAEEFSVLILKRLVEAEGDKEQIYAVIRGCHAPA